MGFKIKGFNEVLGNMVDWITSNNSKLTNFYVGSVIRTFLEAVAVEIESMYFQMYKGFKYAIENSIYHSFGFYKLPASYATGQVTFTFKTALTMPLLVPKGYQLSTLPINGQVVTFQVSQDTVASTGAMSAVVPITCIQSDVVGNVPANTITIGVIRIPEVAVINNNAATSGGAPEETSDARKSRFTQYIDTLSKATVDAVHYGCISVANVAGAYVNEDVGMLYIYAHNVAGDLPDTLKQSIQNSLLNFKAAGIEIQILPVTKRPIDLNVNITLASGFDIPTYQTLITNSITSYLNSYIVDRDLLRAELIRYIMTIDENAIINCGISLTADIITSNYEIIKAGTINVTITQ